MQISQENIRECNFHFPKYSNQSSADKIRKTGSYWEDITCYLSS